MNFQYKILKVNDHEPTINVEYTPSNSSLSTILGKVSLDISKLSDLSGTSLTDYIEEQIIDQAPYSKWDKEASYNSVKNKIFGLSKESTQATKPVTPEPSLEELKTTKREQIDTWRRESESKGFTFDFNGTQDVVQTRHLEDFRNIQGSVTNAIVLQQKGDTGTTLPFRAESDTTYNLVASDMIALGIATITHIYEQYNTSWSLKDQVSSAEDKLALNTITWPVK